MRFRPCIDIHDGKVKQIVGGSLDDISGAETNYISEHGAEFFGRLYRNCDIPGGHIILLNKAGTAEYLEDIRAASEALKEYPGGFMIGGGITPDNAAEYLKIGASHVIVTSYVFSDGKIDKKRLDELVSVAGRDHLVLDLSCRKKNQEDPSYYIVTDRWQKFTDTILDHETLYQLSGYCDEFLIHAVDVEGKRGGIDKELIAMLGSWHGSNPITYAGGVSDFDDLRTIKQLGKNKVDVSIGSALTIFGGNMDFNEVVSFCKGEIE